MEEAQRPEAHQKPQQPHAKTDASGETANEETADTTRNRRAEQQKRNKSRMQKQNKMQETERKRHGAPTVAGQIGGSDGRFIFDIPRLRTRRPGE